MPFAEWLFRMTEARLAPQARELAIYAAVFKVTTNEELAKLAGMETTRAGKEIADKTYNGWKKKLSEGGWVIVKAITLGRVTTVEVSPALKWEPVTFTDVSPRDARKFYESKSYGETVEDTDETPVPNVEVTDDPRNSYVPAVEPTTVSRAPAPALMESLRDSYTLGSEVKSPFTPQTSEPRVTFENGRLVLFNGLKAEWLSLFDGDELKLDLALKQAAGYVQPNSITKSLEAQVSAQLARKVADKLDKDARYDKAVKTNAKPSGSKRMSLDELSAAVDTTFAPKTPRITHER